MRATFQSDTKLLATSLFSGKYTIGRYSNSIRFHGIGINSSYYQFRCITNPLTYIDATDETFLLKLHECSESGRCSTPTFSCSPP